MYLSSILIDLGDNPDRPRPGRQWLRNIYHVHQRLCMAFPSKDREGKDPDFLKPFKPDDFGNGQVHVTRKADSGFLFRIDPQPNGRAVILVQSAVEPNWEYAFHNAGYLLAAPAEVKSFDPGFTKGQRLRFRLVANPTRRLSKNSLGADGQPLKDKKWIGKRAPVPVDQLCAWLIRRAEESGFFVEDGATSVVPGYIYMNKCRGSKGQGQRLFTARYEGILEVTDPAGFKETLIRGIGPGKAFGFGLLSVAPLHVEAK